MSKVLLTGAGGYIGKHVALQLLNKGYAVRASVRDLKRSQEIKDALRPHLVSGIDIESALTFVVLDLNKDAGWNEALAGIDVLMHTASPFPIASPQDENELIRPAVEGTLRAMRAAKSAGVKRVVLTSSVAAIYGIDLPSGVTEFDETMWTDVLHPVGKKAYTKSKTLAEKAAWDFVKNEASEISLTTINPVLVLGVPLDSNFGSSISVVERVLKGKDPMLPDLRFAIVDVKDVAKMHVDCIDVKATYGQRIVASAGTLSFVEIAKIIKSAFPASNTKTGKAPNFLIKFLANFDDDIKAVLPLLGKPMLVSNKKAKSLLGISFISAQTSVEESAAFLLKNQRLTSSDSSLN
jgi:dihydroflavonol-4-reductase